MTEDQIKYIASLPEYADFRFRSEYGRTVVVVERPTGRYEMNEEGDLFWFGIRSSIMWGKPDRLIYDN